MAESSPSTHNRGYSPRRIATRTATEVVLEITRLGSDCDAHAHGQVYGSTIVTDMLLLWPFLESKQTVLHENL